MTVAAGAAEGMDEVELAVAGLDPDASPRAPTEEEWAVLSEEERQRVVDALPAGWTMAELEAQPPEGDWHREARSTVFDTLHDFFDRIGKRIYLTSDLKVYYPGKRAFAPDVLAVLDVEPKKRTKWGVSAEGKGLDWVLEVLHEGDRRKDLDRNVASYAELGIAEYFVYDCGLGLLWGYRLPTSRARRYEPIPPSDQSGRLPSAVLGIELGLVSGQLSFYYGTAELLDRARLVRQLGGLVAEVQEKRQKEWRQAEEERARAEERLWQSRREAVLSVMRARGLPLDEEARTRIESCRDETLLQRWLVRAVTAASAEEVIG